MANFEIISLTDSFFFLICFACMISLNLANFLVDCWEVLGLSWAHKVCLIVKLYLLWSFSNILSIFTFLWLACWKIVFSEGLEESLKIWQAYHLPLSNAICILVKDQYGHQSEVGCCWGVHFLSLPPVLVATMIYHHCQKWCYWKQLSLSIFLETWFSLSKCHFLCLYEKRNTVTIVTSIKLKITEWVGSFLFESENCSINQKITHSVRPHIKITWLEICCNLVFIGTEGAWLILYWPFCQPTRK